MTRLQMAVVGVGSLGQHHARILAGFDDVELVGVVDPRAEQGREIAHRLGTKWVPDIASLPDALDGVVIATPSIHHPESASEFLSRSIPTLVEKPLAASLQDALHLSAIAQRTKTILQVGHVERFNPAFELLQQQCGQPLYIRCQRISPYSFRSTDIGVVHDLMIHDIDLCLTLTGEFPESVEAFGGAAIGPNEDMAVARIRMPSGTIVDITSSRLAPTAERTMQVWGTDSCLSVDLQTRILTQWQPAAQFRNSPALVQAIISASPNPMSLKDSVFGEWITEVQTQAASSDALTAELRDFMNAIRNQSFPRVTGSDAVNAMRVADQVIESLNAWSLQTGDRLLQTRAA